MPNESRTNSTPWQTSRTLACTPKKLKGHPNSPLYSFRVGQYRIILVFEDNVMVIAVIDVGNRSNVYRKY